MDVQLRVSGPGGVGCTVAVGAGSAIKDVKALLESHLGIPAAEQTILFNGAELSELGSLIGGGDSQGNLWDVVLKRGAPGTPDSELTKWLACIAEPNGPGHQSLREAPERVRASREVILAAIARHGCALEFASPALRADPAVVLAAVEQSAQAFRFAAPELRSDRGFVLQVLGKNGLALGCLNSELRSDRNMVLAAVQEDGAAFQYAAEALKADSEFVLEAARWGVEALQHAREVLWEDADFVLASSELSPTAFDLSAAHLWHDRGFVLEAVRRQACALDFAVEELIEDPEFVLDAVDCNPKALDFVPAPSRPATAASVGPKVRVEVTDVAALVSQLLLRLPAKEQAFRVANVVDDRTFEIAHVHRPVTSPDEFWPRGCNLTQAQRVDLFWKSTRGHLSLPATACLAASLRAVCDSGLQLAHEGVAVENILVMHTIVDASDLTSKQLRLVLPEAVAPFLVPATESSSPRPGDVEGDIGSSGDTLQRSGVAHWWLSVVVKAGPQASPQMIHLDLCGPCLDLFDYLPALRGHGDSSLPPPVHVFRTPAYPLHLSMVQDDRRRFVCHAGGLTVPSGVRHVQCLSQHRGGPGDELTALPLDEFLAQQRELLGEIAARSTASKVCSAFVQRLASGVGVRVGDGAKAPPHLKGKVGRVLDCPGTDGPGGRLRVRIGNKDVMFSPEALKIFPPCSLPQFRSFEDVARGIEDMEALFPAGSQVTIVSKGDLSLFHGKHADVLRYNPASGRFQVRLLDDSGDLKAVFPWDLEPRYLDDEAVKLFLQSDDPASRKLAAQLAQETDFPFTLLADAEVASLVRRLLAAGFWTGYHVQEELLSAFCKLAEHPCAARAMQVLQEREGAKELLGSEAVTLRASLDVEVKANPGLQHVLDRHEALRTSSAASTARWACHGPRHRGTVQLDPYELRRKVGLED